MFEVKKEIEEKMTKEYGHPDLLDSSSSDSETFQKVRKKESEEYTEGAAGGSQIHTKQTSKLLFGSLKRRFKFADAKKEKTVKSKFSVNPLKISKPSKENEKFSQHDVYEIETDDEVIHLAKNQKSRIKGKGPSEVGRKKKGEECLVLPSVDELLKLPETVGSTGKTMDDILDEVDQEIRESQAQHERKMMLLDRNLEVLRTQKEEREKRMAANAILKSRLAKDLTRPVLKKLFSANLSYLEDVKAGRIRSERHTAFHANLGSRQALLYQMINNPFTGDQVDWTYEEMARVWAKTPKDLT